MSNTGQAVLTVVGTVVGAYFGYPQLGFALGSLAGQALFPTKLPTVSGPRLSDFGQTQSSVGAPIPQGWGTCPATGNIIAKSDIREVIQSDEVGGKGGPTQTIETPTYFQDFAIGFNDGEIAGVRRIWSNGKLIYDRRPRLDTESDSAFTERMAANDLLDEGMVVYFGTEDQEPDPSLEAFYGIGEVSAYRGLAYVVFVNWQNKPEDGNKMPLSWRIEFFTSGTVNTNDDDEVSNEVLFPWLPGFPLNPENQHEIKIFSVGIGDPSVITGQIVSTVQEGITLVESFRGKDISQFQGVSASAALLGGIEGSVTNLMGGAEAVETDRSMILLHYNTFEANDAYSTKPAYGTSISSGGYFDCFAGFPGGHVILTDDGFTLIGTFTGTGNKQYKVVSAAVVTNEVGWDFVNTSICAHLSDNMLESVGMALSVERIPRAPDDPCDPMSSTATVRRLPGSTNFAIVNGSLKRCGPWERVNANARVMQRYAVGPPVTYPRNPAIPVGDPREFDQDFWEDAYAEQVAQGLMNSGLIYGVHYPKLQGFYYKRVVQLETYETHPVALSEIVHDLCIQAGYQESDISTDDLSDSLVLGFVRTGPMAARGCIEALRPMAMFDECEDDGVIRFVKRGKGIVDTVRDEDLGAFYASEDGADGKQPVSKITTTKMMDYDIPRQVRLHYLSFDRDYDAGQADSPVRTDTDAVQAVDFDTTCVLTDDLAAQIVQRIWADFWAGRWQHVIYLDASAHKYKPTDCLAVPVDGQYQRMRIGSITDKLPSIRQLELVRDDSASFISYALGSTLPPQFTEVITLNSPCDVILLDLPLLRDADNDAGIYAVAVPALVGSPFRGAVLVRSVDGSNFSRVAQFSTAGVVGNILAAPDDNADPSVIDRVSELVIDLPSGTLASKTLAEVLAGSNAAAIGADGRWEIVQWLDAELILDTTWRLTGLLRGRRGTEHVIGSTVVGDKFVVLANVSRVPVDIVGLNKEFQYKCVATGQTLENAETVLFTGHGVALKPFSPALVDGDLNHSDYSWVFTWLRRGRIGQTMQSGTDIALSEEVRDYEVDIYNNGEVIRTLSVSVETATYTSDMQITDFGERQLHTLEIEVFQNSTSVGRGYGTRVVLTASA